MKIKIIHLYYDILNLYGEYGNTLVLERALRENGFEAEIINRTLSDEIDFESADVIYIGCGTEKKQLLCLKHLVTLKREIKSFIESGKLVIATGNSFELFGKKLLYSDEAYDGAGIFDFETRLDLSKRDLGDAICSFSGDSNKIVGFINKCSDVHGVDEPLFKVEFGPGAGGEDGIRYKNFFGTHLIGPLLVKNPYFLRYIVNIICNAKNVEIKKSDEDSFAFKAYRTTLYELTKRSQAGGGK